MPLVRINFKTIAEKSDFKSTSDYDDVIAFIEQLKKFISIYKN